MKKAFSIALVALMLFQTVSLSALPVAAQVMADQTRLTNKDIVEMTKTGMSETIYIG